MGSPRPWDLAVFLAGHGSGSGLGAQKNDGNDSKMFSIQVSKTSNSLTDFGRFWVSWPPLGHPTLAGREGNAEGRSGYGERARKGKDFLGAQSALSTPN